MKLDHCLGLLFCYLDYDHGPNSKSRKSNMETTGKKNRSQREITSLALNYTHDLHHTLLSSLMLFVLALE